jgi:hypothetical protein
MTEYLLKTGKHTVTAITRPDSTTQLPEGVKVTKVDYNNHLSLVDAFQGQDVLVITLPAFATPDTESKLVKAAGDAGIQWILPNEWCPDTANEGLIRDIAVFQSKPKIYQEIVKLGKSSYIAVNTGFWYEMCLANPHAYGFDFEKQSVTFFDDGETLVSMSTFAQVGRAVASLLSLPIQPEGDDKSHCLQHFRNRNVYVSSFTISQKDMFGSVLRVTGTNPEDWTITKEPSNERYQTGLKEMQGGDMAGYAKMMITRVFYPDDSGNYEKIRGTSNQLLGLPKERLDEATEAAIKGAKGVKWGQ